MNEEENVLKTSEMQRACRGCMYFCAATPSCDYYLMVKQRRMCPAGEGCTRKILGEKPRVMTNKPFKIPKDERTDYVRSRKDERRERGQV